MDDAFFPAADHHRGQQKIGAVWLFLAAPGWMLAFFVFAIASALTAIHRPEWITPAWTLPLLLFSVNLVAAVVSRPRFRHDTLLLGLHLGLLAFVLLVATARLTYLDGAVSLNQGAVFDGHLHARQSGPLHPERLSQLRFANEGFVEDHTRQETWKSTYNRIRWWSANGESQVAQIGDDHPLLLDGYRIYTTHNRGYAPVFRWQPHQGKEEIGSVQLRAGEDMAQANLWSLPGGPQLWVMLESQEAFHLLPGGRRENLNAGATNHTIVLRSDTRREVMRPGETLDFAEGRLTYLSLQTWMGYRIVYDLAMHWMAATAVVVIASLIAYYWRSFRISRDG